VYLLYVTVYERLHIVQMTCDWIFYFYRCYYLAFAVGLGKFMYNMQETLVKNSTEILRSFHSTA